MPALTANSATNAHTRHSPHWCWLSLSAVNIPLTLTRRPGATIQTRPTPQHEPDCPRPDVRPVWFTECFLPALGRLATPLLFLRAFTSPCGEPSAAPARPRRQQQPAIRAVTRKEGDFNASTTDRDGESDRWPPVTSRGSRAAGRPGQSDESGLRKDRQDSEVSSHYCYTQWETCESLVSGTFRAVIVDCS